MAVLFLAGGPQFLELVDDENGRVLDVEGAGELVRTCRRGGQDDGLPVAEIGLVGTDGGSDTGPQQRRLARAGRTDDEDHPRPLSGDRGADPAENVLGDVVAAEEPFGVLRLEGGQTAIGDRAGVPALGPCLPGATRSRDPGVRLGLVGDPARREHGAEGRLAGAGRQVLSGEPSGDRAVQCPGRVDDVTDGQSRSGSQGGQGPAELGPGGDGGRVGRLHGCFRHLRFPREGSAFPQVSNVWLYGFRTGSRAGVGLRTDGDEDSGWRIRAGSQTLRQPRGGSP